MTFLTRRKAIDMVDAPGHGQRLRRSLSWPHLVGLGVGAIVGTGIYTLIGVGADRAGPAVILAFFIAGLVCVCVALAYAELATMIPASGSAYTYSYSVLGEGLAWLIGWSLILEYSVVCSAVAVGWSGYAVGFLQSAGIHLPIEIIAGPHAGGILNLPAIFIIAAVAGLLLIGTRESASVNAVLVVFKILALVIFIALTIPAFQAGHFEPFMPYGFASSEETGTAKGVMAAAAIIFFAFYGFDAVSTAAEEAKNPGRDLTIGIIGSMVVCTLLYMGVAAVAIGAMPYTEFAASGEPLAHVLRTLGHPQMATLIGAVAVIALPTVILAFMFGQSRIFFVMARDGLLPPRLGSVNARGVPVAVTVGTAIVVAAIAGIFPLAEIAELANAGTLAAFTAVGACLILLRLREPERPRVFRAPLFWLVGGLAIVGCVYLFISLPSITQERFLIWNAIGVAVYLAYGARKSRLANPESHQPALNKALD
ncbi:amino acid permease [Pedomonas mirosovicensis]|uniref:amino acid permease n=1 Tax=Pedomonas mirosovicensis TaxID=2908641 RepID=UPI00216A36E9|nr:amino acid permease [Pedomonas mirosovicensis]MCH8684536.1 amino acid permease [Pedomonas mirosovicensis]